MKSGKRYTFAFLGMTIALLVFFIVTIVFSWVCPIKGPTIIYKLLPVLYFIILLVYTFISMKKWDEDYDKKNKDMK